MAHSGNLFQDAGQAMKGQHSLLLTASRSPGFCTCKVQRTTTTKCRKHGRLNPRISLQLLTPAFWPPSRGYLPRHSWWCRRGLPETLLQSTSLAFLLFGPDGSNRRCKSSWTSQSLPRTPSCRPVACQVETGSERPGEAQFALLTDMRRLMHMPSAGWPLKHIVCDCLSLLQIKERQERKA